MIVIIGLIVLIAAVVVAVAGVATNSGSSHPLGDNFGIFGQHLTNASTGQLFLSGIVIGIVGMLGLNMLLGAFSRRLASGGMRRQLKATQRESEILRVDRDRLMKQLDEERAAKLSNETRRVGDATQSVETPPNAT